MPLRLILMRHAKSSWDDPDLPDRDRPLNARGQRAARALGEWLASRGHQPDGVLCSSARRTIETWEGIAPALPDAPTPQLLEALYQADPDTILSCLRQASGRCVLLLGHNPGIAALAASLPKEPPLGPSFAHFPTGATLVLAFEAVGWAEIAPGDGRVLDFIVPRDLE
jgi:phosphohistidine phosphatase